MDYPPQGRARGRARGVPVTLQGGAAENRPPGVAPPAVQAALLGRGRGRGDEASPVVVAAGRSSRTRVASAATTRMGEIEKAVGAVQISSSESEATGSNGHNGSGSGASPNSDPQRGAATTTRGAVRGRPVDNKILRTFPSIINTKQGSEGTAIALNGNFFALKKHTKWRLLQYRVDMTPEVDYTKERKYYVKSYEGLKNTNFIFDGTILITKDQLPEHKWTTKRSSDDQAIEISMRLVGEIDTTSNTYLQFMNIILRSLLEKLQLDLIGRDYFDSKAKISDPKLIKNKLELYPGYKTSIRQHEHDILLNVEITHKVLRIDSVYDVIKELKNRSRNLKDDINRALLGQIVITKYNNKTYKIAEVRFDMSPNMEFEDKKGNKVRYLDYYQKRWNMKISDPNQPLIVSIPKERDLKGMKQPPVQLVPELCNMTGLSDEQRADFRLMQDVAVYTRQDPNMKTKALLNFAKRINNTPEIKKVLDEWDIEFGNSLVSVPGRQLTPETIVGGGTCQTSYQISNADWGNAFRKWTCLAVATLKKWVIITPKRDESAAKELEECLRKIFPGIGMEVARPKVEVINDSKAGSYKEALDRWLPKNPEMVMVVLPNQNEDLYSVVKKQCYIQHAVPSQVVTGRVLSKPKGLMSVATKIALQMNCKLGGQLWGVKIPLKGVMVIGYDTYHDSQQKGKSVGALVASLNKECTQYFSTTEHHDSIGAAIEITDKICVMVNSAMRAYKEVNNAFPERIFFYRDGVGDGQIPFVHETEIGSLKKAIGEFSAECKLTFIITSKRINARFLVPIMGDRAGNPNSGTVVDDVVTLPERYDFYLVSQSVRQGTVNPTSYNVIYADFALPPGRLQQLTYKLTHLYFNWAGTVRVPAPVQYAHKLAYLVGTSLHAKPNSALENLLYYL